MSVPAVPPAVLWHAAEAAQATGGSVTAGWVANDVSIDSRTSRPGALFIALRGDARDGHAFVADAMARGAAAAMVEHVPDGVSADAPLLCVDDTLEALNALGAAARARCPARIVAVTGSAGKTGTKEMLRAALQRQARTHASAASYNNHWGVPLSLARMPRDAQFGVFELGMNHAGEITPLSKLVRPDAAIITTIAPAHAGNFNALAGIALAKSEIFLGLQPAGVAIINRDNAFFDLLAARARDAGAGQVIGFGRSSQAAARLIKAAHHPDCSCIAAEIGGQALTYKIGMPGEHWAMNSLAVLAAVQALGGDLALAAMALGEIKPLAGRGQRHHLPLADGFFTLIDESYNANPGSMRAALSGLAGQNTGGRGRRVAVLGAMAELGSESDRYHLELAQAIISGGIDLVFAAGPQMRLLFDALPAHLRGAHATSAGELAPEVIDCLRSGDVLMVKGSNSSGMGVVVEALLARHGGDAPVQPVAAAGGNGNAV